MPKRKVIPDPSDEDSDLSSAPEIIELGDSLPVESEPAISPPPAKKRKTTVKSKVVKKETVVGDVDQGPSAVAKPKVKRAAKKVKAEIVKTEIEEETVEGAADAAQSPKIKKRSTKKAAIIFETEANGDGEAAKPKVIRKRKTQEEKEAEARPLASRTIGHKLFIGAHISSAGGVQNAPVNSVHIGANAFALFLKSQRKWVNPPLVDEVATSFHEGCKHHSYDQTKHVVPHGSYLVNLAHTDEARTTQAYDAFLDDLQRCERLGIKLYNFHPGVANSTPDRAKAIAHLASNINRAHAATSTVVTLLENMAAGGNVLGSSFEDLRDTIALVDNKDRIGVCLDTCHAFAAGWDLRTPEAFQNTMTKFDGKVGMKYLKAMHINDSKAPFGSRRDLHANIGTGFLGLRAFHNIVNDSRFEGLPLILETPIEVKDADGNNIKDEKGKDKEDKAIWAIEIKLLESMVGMDVESEEYLTLERNLARNGEPERKRLQEQIDRKGEKEEKKRLKGEGKGKKGKKESSESELGEEED